MTALRQPDPADWGSQFSAAAAWSAACQQAAQAWMDVAEQMGQAAFEMARLQSEGFAQLLSMGLGAADGVRMASDLMGCGLGAAASESDQLAQAALHLVEDIGPGDRAYVPLPE